jgi:hypothetical protein
MTFDAVFRAQGDQPASLRRGGQGFEAEAPALGDDGQ